LLIVNGICALKARCYNAFGERAKAPPQAVKLLSKGHRFYVDIFARPVNSDDYSIIGEVKNREVKKFSLDQLKEFQLKFAEIKRRENLERGAVVGFIFSRAGFTKEAEAYCREKGIACSEDERWLETGK
jgi:hypothetical protein